MKKQKAISRLLAFAICVVMVFSMVPFTAFAAIDNYNANYESATHTVFKHTEQTLAPGVTQYTNYAYTTADNQQMVYYVTTADVNREDVMMQISYKGMQHDVYGMEKLADTVATANAKYSDPSNEEFISEYYTVVSAVNGNGYNMTTGKPSGVWAMGGEVITDYTGGSCYLAIDGTGKAVMGKTVQEWNALKSGAGVQEAINCFGSILVWDGAIQITQTSSYYSDRASRTMVGVTEDGKVVCCVVDGRQPPFSCGASMLELAHIMLEAGCKYAMNLDGGGSTTYMAKNEGSDKCTVNNRPSDGSERAISNGIIIASLAAPSNVFDHVSMEVADQYVTVGASTEVNVIGVSPAGTSAEIPAEITYETTNGTYSDGIFTANALGTATITAKLGDDEVGSVNINVVTPTSISFVNSTMTVPYGKTVAINIEAKYNLSDVKYCADNFVMTLSDNSIGTIKGLKFTASDGSCATESKLTVECGSLSTECTIKLGKGSVVLFDFEDDSQIDAFTINEWPNYHKANVGGKIEITNAETGKVRNGNQSLAVTADFTQLVDNTDGGKANEQGGADYVELNLQVKQDYWSQWDKYNLKGATAVGFWIYIPDEMDVTCVYPRICFDWSDDGVTWTKGQRITAWMTAPNRPSGDNAHLDDYGEGWVYFSVDTSKFAGKNYLKFGSESNYFIEFYVEEGGWKKDNAAGYSKMTFYLDDITVDYSTAVDDREAPVFSNFTYAAEGIFDALALNNNAVLTKNSKYDFNVKVVENTTKDNYTGLNLNSFKAYVDGVEKLCTFTNGNLAISNITLNDGAHTVKFYAEDNLGNSSYIVRNFKINANIDYVTTSLVAHDETITSVLCGSLYYVDLKVSDISKVNSFKTVLKVVNTNDWEPQGIIVADGFSCTYSLDTVTGRLTLDIEKTGKVQAQGEAVIASVPVRAWYVHDSIGGDWITAEEAAMRRFAWPKRIQIASKFGEMETTDGTLSFSYDEFLIDTEMMPVAGAKGYPLANGNRTVHSHTPESIADLPATCTKAGYTGRTFCADCNSVIDWGTEVPATGHSYGFVDGILQCTECGDLFSGEYQGVHYTDGIAENGWAGNSYYVDGVKVTGIKLIDGYYYDFGENGVCENKTKYTGLFYDEQSGVYRYSQIGEFSSGWKQINDEWYYFRASTMAAATGTYDMTWYFELPVVYEFDQTGRLLHGEWVEFENGNRYFYGPSFYVAARYSTVTWATINGETYGFDEKGFMYTGIHGVLESNQKIPVFYDFGTDGKLIGAITGPLYWDDAYYYCVDGLKVSNLGLVENNGNYYYVRSNGQLATGTYEIWNGNGIVPDHTVETFAEDGKMILKSGIIEENGGLYYYIAGELQKNKGLIEINGDYYYVRTSGQLATGTYEIWNGNGIVPDHTVGTFAEDGRMIFKSGIIEENGGLYYYIAGELQKNKGLIEIDGDYYYVRTSGQLATGTYEIWNGNGIVPDHTVGTFTDDGKLFFKDGIIEENGALYYYIVGELQKHKGLVEVDGYYYYVRTSGQLATGTYEIWNGNGIVPDHTIGTFTADGKLIMD